MKLTIKAGDAPAMNKRSFHSLVLATLFTLACAANLLAQQLQTNLPVATEPKPNMAVIPVPREQDSPRRRFELLNERVKAAQGNVDLAFIGDSITQGWEGNGKNVWQKFYGSRKALNLGIGGDRTQHVLWRLDHENIDGIKPKVAVIMIGTNNSNGEDHTPGEIVEGVTAIVQKLRERLPELKILLLGIFPRGADFSNQRGKILQVNQAIHKLEDGRNVWFLDFGHLLIEPNGKISKVIMPDYLHLSEKGYEIWAEAIESKLAELLGAPRASGKADLSGEWGWKARGPQGEDVEGAVNFKPDGATLTGTIVAGENRRFEIENGHWENDRLQFVFRRNRSQGGAMVYHATAKLDGEQLNGTVETEADGNPVKQDWTARRKQ